MGLTESKPAEETALVKTTNNIIELYQQKTDEMCLHNTLLLQYISILENKCKSNIGLTQPVLARRFLSKRNDGSSVKELLVEAWDAVFFIQGGELDVRLNNGVLKPGVNDELVQLELEHSKKLYDAYVKWRDAAAAKFAAQSAFNSYMKIENKF